MKQIIVQESQTIVDIALQELGSVEGLFALLDANPDLYLDSELDAGQKVLVNESDIVNQDIVNYYRRKGISPNGGF